MILPLFLLFSAVILVWVITFVLRIYILIVSGTYNGWGFHIATNSAAALALIILWILVYTLMGVKV